MMDERLKKQLDFSLEIDKEKNVFRHTRSKIALPDTFFVRPEYFPCVLGQKTHNVHNKLKFN